jgi:hypothetical protein
MALLCLLPMGVLQVAAAIDHGYWYARSAEFMGWHRCEAPRLKATPTAQPGGRRLVQWFPTGHRAGRFENPDQSRSTGAAP